MFGIVDKCYQGVDWVTVTSSINGNRTASVALISGAAEHLREEMFSNIPRKTIESSVKGKRHWVCGDLTYKGGEHGNMLSVSGKRASEAWCTLSTLVTDVHFSRLDLALDCALQTSAPKILRTMYAYCTEHQSDKRSVPPVLISNDLGDTLYLGSRQSPLFLRIYDKSKEYKLQRGSVYRFETESKQHRGDRLAKAMASNAYNLADWITGQVVRDFDSRGVTLPSKFARAENLPTLELGITTSEATLRWYRRQVAPSVKRLLSEGVSRETIQRDLGFGKVDSETI